MTNDSQWPPIENGMPWRSRTETNKTVTPQLMNETKRKRFFIFSFSLSLSPFNFYLRVFLFIQALRGNKNEYSNEETILIINYERSFFLPTVATWIPISWRMTDEYR